jgi:hypothetical protein
MAATVTAPALSDGKLAELLALIEDAESVELKLTVPVSERSAAGVALGVYATDTTARWWPSSGSIRTTP